MKVLKNNELYKILDSSSVNFTLNLMILTIKLHILF